MKHRKDVAFRKLQGCTLSSNQRTKSKAGVPKFSALMDSHIGLQLRYMGSSTIFVSQWLLIRRPLSGKVSLTITASIHHSIFKTIFCKILF